MTSPWVRVREDFAVTRFGWLDLGSRTYSTGESALLSTFRELVAQNFGDQGLGQALASLQGRALCKHSIQSVASASAIQLFLLCSQAL